MTTAKIIYEGGLRTRCIHTKSESTILTDAPTDNHGKGEAFSPTDLVSTALVSCMLTIMDITAQKHDIPFGSASATMQKIMAENPRRISEIIVTIQMPKVDYSEKEKRVLEEAALNCPVGKSLNPEIQEKISFDYPASID